MVGIDRLGLAEVWVLSEGRIQNQGLSPIQSVGVRPDSRGTPSSPCRLLSWECLA